MFLLSFIPDALIQLIVNGILIAGIVGCVVSFFFGFFVRWMPWIIPYRMLLQIVALILLIAGVYFKGGIGVEMEWRERLRVAEEKIKVAEEKSQQVNTVIEKVYVDRVKTVKDVQVVVQEKIVEKEKIIDAECKVPKEAIDILNEAAKTPGGKK
jgi:hypothetical protein